MMLERGIWELNPSDELFVRNQEDKWLPAVIQRKTEPLSFHNLQMAEVEMSQLRLHNVHVVAPERPVEWEIPEKYND